MTAKAAKVVLTPSYQFTVLGEDEQLPSHIRNLDDPLLLSLRLTPDTKKSSLESSTHEPEFLFFLVFCL